jgi:divalent metal cation (Fe/Co/Zn/Cd) transporter
MTAGARDHLVRQACRLAKLTIAYNLVEGAVSLACGTGDESLALLGFGVDSFIEVASATLVLWRLRAEASGATVAAARERTAGMWVSALLMLLGVATIGGSVWQLVHHGHPETTRAGAIIALLSLSFMFWLWRRKRALATALQSRTLRQDAACSLGCIQLSVTLLVGSLLYMVAPAFWWADATAAIIIAVLISRDGWLGFRSARRGEGGGCGCAHACS